MMRALWVELQPPSLERAFRVSARVRYAPQVKIVFLFGILVVSLFAGIDLVFMDDQEALPLVLGARATSVLGLGTALWIIDSKRSVESMEWSVLFGALLHVWAYLFIQLVGPYGDATALLWAVLTVVCLYSITPVPLVSLLPATALLTLGQVFFCCTGDGATSGPMNRITILLGLVSANALGIAASIQLGRLRRRRFALSIEEIGERVELEKALMEVQELRAIIPICMHCKSIRSGEGYWEQVEKYVGSKLGADLSHGICPECVSEHYPEVAAELEEEEGPREEERCGLDETTVRDVA